MFCKLFTYVRSIISSIDVCRYSAEEIHFNLMAIVSDRLQQYQNSINEIHKQIEVSRLLTSFKMNIREQLNLIFKKPSGNFQHRQVLGIFCFDKT